MSTFTIYSPNPGVTLRENSYMNVDATFVSFPDKTTGTRSDEASDVAMLNWPLPAEDSAVFQSMSHGERKLVGTRVFCHQG